MKDTPHLRITYQEAKSLPEYSCSHPTGTTIGKRWRRHNGSYDRDWIRAGGKPYWLICEYAECDPPREDRVAIKMYRPLIRVKANSRRV